MKLLARLLTYGGFLIGIFGSWFTGAATESFAASMTVFGIGAAMFIVGIVLALIPSRKLRA